MMINSFHLNEINMLKSVVDAQSNKITVLENIMITESVITNPQSKTTAGPTKSIHDKSGEIDILKAEQLSCEASKVELLEKTAVTLQTDLRTNSGAISNQSDGGRSP